MVFTACMTDNYLGTTAGELDYLFGNHVGIARVKLLKDPKYEANTHRDDFITGLQRAIQEDLPEGQGVTHNHLMTMSELASQDWSGVDTIKALYNLFGEIRGKEYNIDMGKLFGQQSSVKNVIVADDSQSWRDMYVEEVQFAFPDVHVDSVESGSELVNRVLSGNYSLVLSDNDMEEHDDGLKALRTIREAGNNVPFYLLSAKSIGEEVLSSGANGFYDKADFDSDKLVADITQHLK